MFMATAAVVVLLVLKCKAIFRRSLWYILAINPVTTIATIFFLGMVLDSAIFG
jgi:hypothetical protein